MIDCNIVNEKLRSIGSKEDAANFVSWFIESTNDPTENESEQIWEESEKIFLNSLVLYLWYTRSRNEEISISGIRSLISFASTDNNSPDTKSSLDEMFASLAKERGEDNIAVQIYHLFKMAAGKAMKAVAIKLDSRFNALPAGTSRPTDTKDPLQNIETEEDIQVFTDKLFADANPDTRLWDESAKLLLDSLLLYMLYKHKKAGFSMSFSNLIKLISLSSLDENDPETDPPLDRLFAELAKDLGTDNLAIQEYRLARLLPSKTFRSIAAMLAAKLRPFMFADIQHKAN